MPDNSPLQWLRADWVGAQAGGSGRIEHFADRPKVSVIVPVFGASSAVERCLSALLSDPPRLLDEVLVIDDHSAQTEIDTLLRRFSEDHDQLRLIEAPQNRGFVRSVNLGMREASTKNDCVLLNSDTVVPRGWLEGLSRAAHSRVRVATACALSNAAGFFSVPKPYANAELPQSLSVEGAQALVNLSSPHDFPEAPTTSGFCQYIRREAIEEIGVFDERLFHRGYGEESDYCTRALEAGFTHVVDDGTFVYHSRAASFGAAKKTLKERNSRVLKALHPSYIDSLRRFEQSDPTRILGNRLTGHWTCAAPGRCHSFAFGGEGSEEQPAVRTSAGRLELSYSPWGQLTLEGPVERALSWLVVRLGFMSCSPRTNVPADLLSILQDLHVEFDDAP